MEYDDVSRIVAAQLATALIGPRRDGFTGATVQPTVDEALTIYSECLKKLREVSAKDPKSC